MTGGTSPTAVVRDATADPVASVGYVISGTLHLLIAYIIVRIAIGSGGDADQTGALRAIAGTTGGSAALWAVAVALVPLTRLMRSTEGQAVLVVIGPLSPPLGATSPIREHHANSATTSRFRPDARSPCLVCSAMSLKVWC
jgi:hypothetical protein